VLILSIEIHYLGHVISDKGITMDPTKVKAIMEWHAPTNVPKVRSFMSLAEYYQRLVKGFSKIENPMTKLQKKNKKFVGPRNARKHFEGSRVC
jgi:hypothetical protein